MWTLLLLAATVRSFAHMPLGISHRNNTLVKYKLFRHQCYGKWTSLEALSAICQKISVSSLKAIIFSMAVANFVYFFNFVQRAGSWFCAYSSTVVYKHGIGCCVLYCANVNLQTKVLFCLNLLEIVFCLTRPCFQNKAESWNVFTGRHVHFAKDFTRRHGAGIHLPDLRKVFSCCDDFGTFQVYSAFLHVHFLILFRPLF